MKQFITGMLVALLAVAVYSCTTPGAPGGGGSSVLFKINGRGITSEEFFASAPAKDAVRGYMMLESMKNEAKKYGATVDEKELTTTVEDFKKNITVNSGQSWEDFLKNSQSTEKEFIEQQRNMMLFQALQDKRAKVSEEEIKKVWEDDKDTLITQYATENHLPDSEKAKITFEQVKEIARERVAQSKAQMMQGEIMGDIILNATLEMTSVKDSVKAKQLAEAIVGPQRKQAEEQKKAAAEAAKAEGSSVEDDTAADGDKPNATAEGDAAAEGDIPHDHDGDGVSDHGDDFHDQGGEEAPEEGGE